MTDVMEGPSLKLERAKYHIDQLEAIFREHIAENAKALGPENHRGVSLFGTPIKKYTATIIGDAIHNLRVALDHAYWVTVEANGGQFTRHVKFPFGSTKDSVSGMLNGQPDSGRPSKEVECFILNEIEPFEGGCLDFYDLHLLDITDKHQILLPTYLSLTITPSNPIIIRTSSGALHKELVAPNGPAGIVADSTKSALFGIGEGLYVENKGDLQDAIAILFGPGPLEQRPVLQTLRTLHQNTSSVVDALASLIRKA